MEGRSSTPADESARTPSSRVQQQEIEQAHESRSSSSSHLVPLISDTDDDDEEEEGSRSSSSSRRLVPLISDTDDDDEEEEGFRDPLPHPPLDEMRRKREKIHHQEGSGRKAKRKISDETPRKKQTHLDSLHRLERADTETAGSSPVNPPDPESHVNPMKRSSSFEWLPPNMSELRVVLLGNSWSQRSSVGNFILGENKFNTEEEPDCCLRERGQVKEKEMILINTPDLLHPNISEDNLTEHVKTCERLSDPGPHVFLLVLQPEDFTEEHKLKLCRVLQLFSDRSFDRSLILISTPREESPGFMEKYMEHRPLKDMIRKCRDRHLNQRNIEHSELLTRLGQVVKENNGEHVSCDVSEDPTSTLPGDHQRPKQQETQTSVMGAVKSAGLNIVKGITGHVSLSEKNPLTHKKEEEMKREREELQRKHKKEMKRILKEKKEEMKREREELQRKHEEEMEEMKRRMEEQQTNKKNK